MNLTDMQVEILSKDSQAATQKAVDEYMEQLPEWETIAVDGIDRIQRVYKLKNFRQALDFTNRIGELAEEQDHHPMILTEWGRVTLTWWTHIVRGLHKNDFVSAAKSDDIYEEMKQRSG
jgi:4a-hydroxytetrahydrobiopterin dehydratase